MTASRYRTLDAWRGLASLAVFLFHLDLVSPGSPFRFGWLGVPVFFVVSGYCLAAALARAVETGVSPATFAKRRFLRIAPPYLASLALAVGVTFVVLWWRGAGPLEKLRATPARFWVLNLTLTQWLDALEAAWEGHPLANPAENPALGLNGAYWSLGYEEQFYALMTLALLLSRWMSAVRPLAIVTFVSIAAFSVGPRVTGLFTDYWLQFAVGLVLFVRLHLVRARARLLDGALAGLVVALGVVAAKRGEFPVKAGATGCFPLAFAMVVGLALAWLHPRDAWCSESRLGAALRWIGERSYSLYLVHFPLITLVFALARPGQLRAAQAVLLVLVPLVTYGFHRVFERRQA